MGSLFDGIGVFPLAASRNGIVPIWASEIEKAPMSITKRHFPHMAHLGDIKRLNGREVPPVHVITFGSPCQNLSKVGGREGLAGVKSSLFFDAVRIIQQMREATNGVFPIIAVWENVMGAFSSSDRMDFGTVLESFADSKVSMPPAGRWANAGMVRGGTADIAWRLLDAQYWGRPRLPQRRRRIFLVADFGGQRAGEILFYSGGLLSDSAPCGAGGLSSAEGDRISIEAAGRPIPTIHPFQDRPMRGHASTGDRTGFIRSFGKPTDPFPTLLAGIVNALSLWYGTDYQNGVIRYLTPTECERLMGLPDGWTRKGSEDETIGDAARYKALGNAIALPCAEYIMSGISRSVRAVATSGQVGPK